MNSVKANSHKDEGGAVWGSTEFQKTHSRPVQVALVAATDENLRHSRVTPQRNTRRMSVFPGTAW